MLIGNYSVIDEGDENMGKYFRKADNASRIYIGENYPNWIVDGDIVLNAEIYRSIYMFL